MKTSDGGMPPTNPLTPLRVLVEYAIWFGMMQGDPEVITSCMEAYQASLDPLISTNPVLESLKKAAAIIVVLAEKKSLQKLGQGLATLLNDTRRIEVKIGKACGLEYPI
jgi:hypothetical protein